jgi:histidinol-phosphate aminotransferase
MRGDELVAGIARRLDVDAGQVVIGGGSISLLQQTLVAYTGPGTEVIYAWRSYEAYPIIVGVAGAASVAVPLTDECAHDLEGMLTAITPRTRAIIVCNPNNPTGTEIAQDELVAFLDRVPSGILVLLDEAYWEFRTDNLDGVEIARRYPNVVVFRTFSKAYGLAGLRVGYLVTSSSIAENVRATCLPFGVNAIAEAAASAAWADPEHTARIVSAVTNGREHLESALVELGVPVKASGANFVWAPVGRHARALEAECVAHGVSVRAFDDEGVRITVGEREAENAVITAFGSYLHTTTLDEQQAHHKTVSRGEGTVT